MAVDGMVKIYQKSGAIVEAWPIDANPTCARFPDDWSLTPWPTEEEVARKAAIDKLTTDEMAKMTKMAKIDKPPGPGSSEKV